MKTHHRTIGAITLLTIVVFPIVSAPSITSAATWNNTTGGDWFDFTPTNWSGSSYPTPGQTAAFTNSGTYTTVFDGRQISSYLNSYYNYRFYAPGTSAGLDLTVDLNGFAPTSPTFGAAGGGYALTSSSTEGSSPILIGYSTNNVATVEFANGEVTANGYTTIGYAGGNGTLQIGNGTTLTTRFGYRLGELTNSVGLLEITNGGKVNAGVEGIWGASATMLGYGGSRNGDNMSGTISVDGAGSEYRQYNGILRVGSANASTATRGNVLVTNGGKFSLNDYTGDHIIGDGTNTTGTVSVSGANSRFEIESLSTGQDLYVGFGNGTGVFRVADGGTAELGTDVLLGFNSSSAKGTFEVIGAGSSANISSSLYEPHFIVGYSNSSGQTSLLSVKDGGAVNVDGYVEARGLGMVELDNGGQIISPRFEFSDGGTLQGNGIVDSAVGRGSNNLSTITAQGGTLTLGNYLLANGFDFSGQLEVASGAAVDLRDANTADLRGNTAVTNGVIIARNGATIASGKDVTGYGVSIGSFGGPGAFSMGSSARGSVDLSFDFAGDIANVHSLGIAELGGSTIAGGQIISPNGISVSGGDSLSGNGSVDGNVTLNSGQLIASGGNLAVTGGITGNGLLIETATEKITATSGITASGSATLPELAVGSNEVTVLSQTRANLSGTTTISGGQLNASNGVELGSLATLTGNGTINASVIGGASSIISTSGGDLTLGDAGTFVGFQTSGAVDVGAETLTLHSLGFANLGGLTTVNGGTIAAPNGIALPTGSVLSIGSAVDGRVAAGTGSMIVATDDTQLGNSAAFDGFASEGVLQVDNHTVTLLDQNTASLGALTQVGNATGSGTLIAANGFDLGFGKTLAGYGTVSGDIINNGFIVGQGPLSSDALDFTDTMTGVGDLQGLITFSTGTHSPGFSPVIANVASVTYLSASTLQIELGGTTPGTQYDVIDASGVLTLGGLLDVQLINGFSPSLGDSFGILLADGGIVGYFDATSLPSLPTELQWEANLSNNSLTLNVVNAVPEADAFALASLATVLFGLFAYGRPKRV